MACELAHVANDLGDNRLDVRAVVADEHDDGPVLPADRFERMLFAVDAEQLERRRAKTALAGRCREADHGVLHA